MFRTNATRTQDDFAATLTDTALQVAFRHGARNISVEAELNLWHGLARALRRAPEQLGGRLGFATEAAYRALLRHKPDGTFIDLELDLWQAFRTACSAAPVVTPC